MLKMGKLTIEEIAECSELSVAEVEQLAGLQTVQNDNVENLILQLYSGEITDRSDLFLCFFAAF